MSMSDDRKAAQAQGRNESRAVRAYLDALSQKKPRGGNLENLQSRIDGLTTKIEAEDNSLKRLQMIQQRFDLEDRLKAAGNEVDREALEADFVGVAASYSDRKGITYSTWREFGVSPAVLKAAGVKRTRRI